MLSATKGSEIAKKKMMSRSSSMLNDMSINLKAHLQLQVENTKEQLNYNIKTTNTIDPEFI